MAKVEIYSSAMCPFCHRAKALLKKKGVPFEEIDVTFDAKKRMAMEKRADGRHTVPQIFIDDDGVGGCDELYALEAEGELDTRLGLA